MHNIAEGFDDGSDAEFIRFLKYARRSASEVQSEIYLALDQKYVSEQDFQKVYDMATSTKKIHQRLHRLPAQIQPSHITI